MNFEANMIEVFRRLAAQGAKFLDERFQEAPIEERVPLFMEAENAL